MIQMKTELDLKLAFRVYLVSFHNGSSSSYLTNSVFLLLMLSIKPAFLGRYEVDKIMDILLEIRCSKEVEDKEYIQNGDDKISFDNSENSFKSRTNSICEEFSAEKYI